MPECLNCFAQIIVTQFKQGANYNGTESAVMARRGHVLMSRLPVASASCMACAKDIRGTLGHQFTSSLRTCDDLYSVGLGLAVAISAGLPT